MTALGTLVKQYGMKAYYIGLMSTALFMVTTPVHAANTETCAAGNIPSWLLVLKQLVADPVIWLMWITAATTVIFLIIGGLKIRSARGRQDKVDDAYNFFKYFAGGSFLIFSASGIGTWFLSKFGCTVA